MKKILFSLLFLGALAGMAQAQTCTKNSANGKSCCMAKVADASTTGTSIPADYATAAAKVASLDASIEPRTNPVTGEVSYVRKSTCPHDGMAMYTALSFDPSNNTFVNVGPSMMDAEKTGSSDATKSMSGKSCCAMGAGNGKSCCAGKMKTGAASTSSNGAAAEPKPVKTSGSKN